MPSKHNTYINAEAKTVIDNVLDRLSVSTLTNCINEIVDGKTITLIDRESGSYSPNAVKQFNRNKAQMLDSLEISYRGAYKPDDEMFKQARQLFFKETLQSTYNKLTSPDYKINNAIQIATFFEIIHFGLMVRDELFCMPELLQIDDTHPSKERIINELQSIVDFKGGTRSSFKVHNETNYHNFVRKITASNNQTQHLAAVIFNKLIEDLPSYADEQNGESIEIVKTMLNENFSALANNKISVDTINDKLQIKANKTYSKYQEMILILMNIKLQTECLTETQINFIDKIDKQMEALNEIVHSNNLEKLKIIEIDSKETYQEIGKQVITILLSTAFNILKLLIEFSNPQLEDFLDDFGMKIK